MASRIITIGALKDFDLGKYFAGEIDFPYWFYPAEEEWEMMPPAIIEQAEKDIAEFEAAAAAYQDAINRGDTYDDSGIPLTGDPSQTKPEEEEIADKTTGVTFTKGSPGIIYDPDDPNIFKIGKEKTDYRTNFTYK